jgi:hypothetical protein
MLRLPAIATAVVGAILLTWWLVAYTSGARKLAAAEPLAEPRGNYRITLDFPPERFHQLRLQDRGRLVEVKGNTVFMKDVAPSALRDIAREYWVESVSPWSAP